MIKTIIVPTDGSTHASKAVELAADIAKNNDARLVILHVLLTDASPYQLKALTKGLGLTEETQRELDRLEDLPVQSAEFAGAYGPVTVPVPLEVLQEAGRVIVERARMMAAAKGIENAETAIVGGRPTDSILAAVEHENADMIVMGNRGFGDLKGLLVGSVSHKVSHLAPCTCVTVK